MTDRDDVLLVPEAQQQLERAYQNRSRRQCSLADYAEGYVQALIDQGVPGMFRPLPGSSGTADPSEVVRGVR